MHRNMLMRKRFFVYIQISFFLLGAIYLLVRHDKLPVPASWGIPHYSVDPGPVDPPPADPTTTKDGVGYTVADLPPSVPESDSSDEVDGPEGSLSSSNKAHGDGQEEEAQGGSKAAETEGKVDDGGSRANTTATMTEAAADASPSPSPSPTPPPKPTKEELTTKARTFIPSILDPNNTSIDRMFCPPINSTRYSYLKASKWERKPKYFFALNLRKCVDLLPRLLGSLVETINFLGPEQCAVSIVEGNSDDGTLEVLELLEKEFQRMGVLYYLRSTPLNPSAGDRIQRLAMLRAMAVSPLTGIYVPDTDPDDDDSSPDDLDPQPPNPSSVPQLPLAEEATVLFLNDVAACAEDMLELLHQRSLQSADMTCAMDWTHPGPDPLFYDVWVSRALNGDLFFDIPAETASWDKAEDLFWNEPVARKRLAADKPFQVFACWNGAVAFTAVPLVKNEVGFRSSREGECFQGEPQLFCKDMWYKGYGKILVVPSVNLEYTDKLGRQVKKEKGYVTEIIVDEAEEKNGTGLMVPWKLEPPELVKCMPNFDTQSWLPWNESLPLV